VHQTAADLADVWLETRTETKWPRIRRGDGRRPERWRSPNGLRPKVEGQSAIGIMFNPAFLWATDVTKSQRNSVSGDVKTGDGKNLGFSSEIAVYLGRGTRWAHGYYGSLVESHRWRIDPCGVQWPWVTLQCGTGGSIFGGLQLITLPYFHAGWPKLGWYDMWEKHVFRGHHDPVSRGRGQNVYDPDTANMAWPRMTKFDTSASTYRVEAYFLKISHAPIPMATSSLNIWDLLRARTQNEKKQSNIARLSN